jgi:AAA family ATP:ADP antiporter
VLLFVLFSAADAAQRIWVGRVFFVWLSVFNLFVVSVFWSFMADIFRSEQGKRLFAFIALGGTLGAILGSSITAFFAELTGPVNLLLISGVFLEVAVQVARWLGNRSKDPAREPEAEPEELSSVGIRTAAGRVDPHAERAIGGGVLSGISHVFASPYLLGICAFMLLFTIGSTFLYFQQAEIVTAAIADRAERTAMFAKIDLLVNLLTIVMQVFVTGRILKWFGVAFTLALLPLLSVFGFLALGLMPTLWVIIAVQVVRRAGNFAVARPTREVLFTVVSREDKYKAKNFIDTFVYRGGDQVGAWSYSLMGWLGLGIAGIAFAAVPIAVLWVMISIWLGRRQAERADLEDAEERAAAEPAIA